MAGDGPCEASDLWLVHRSDGTRSHETARQARKELHRRRAIQIGHTAIRRLSSGETYESALDAAALDLSRWHGIPLTVARLVLSCQQAAWQTDPDTMLDSLEETSAVSPEDVALVRSFLRRGQDRERRAYAARLREHQRSVRESHGLRPSDPISAVALPRRAQMPKLVAHGRGPAICGAAGCGGLSVAAIRLAGGSDPSLAAQRDPWDQIERAEIRGQSVSW